MARPRKQGILENDRKTNLSVRVEKESFDNLDRLVGYYKFNQPADLEGKPNKGSVLEYLVNKELLAIEQQSKGVTSKWRLQLLVSLWIKAA